jgi:HAD superfamily hydrolase (TIGR01509 family)
LQNISCVLFDIGGVLVNWDNSWLIREVSTRFQLSESKVSEEFYKNMRFISTGMINENEFWYNIGNKLHSSELSNTHESLWDTIFRKYVSVNLNILSLSKNLSQNGITVGILSNIEHVVHSVIKDLLPLDHFKYKFLSYEIGYQKPDPEIYLHVIDNTPFLKEELFFIDDLKDNVVSARSVGIDSIQYVDYDLLINEFNDRKLFSQN